MADPKKDIKKIPTMSSRAYNTPEPRSTPPAKPKAPRQKPKFVATPGTGFKDNSGTNNQPKTVTSGDRAKEALKKAVKTSVGISPFTAMDTIDPPKKQKKQGFKTSYPLAQSISLDKKDTVSYEMRPGKTTMENIGTKADGTPNMVPSTTYTKKIISNKDYANRMSGGVGRAKTGQKAVGTPVKAMDTVDPTTGQVLPTGMGQGPTNVGNANTAQTLQSQADAEAVKANRAGKPATTADVITQTPMTMQGNFKNSSISTAARMFGNVPNPIPSPSQFNKGFESLPQTVQDQIDPAGKSDKAPTARKVDPDVKAAKKEIRKGGNVTGGSNVLDNFGHEHGYQSDKAKELDNSRLVSRKKRQDNRSEYKHHKIDVKQFGGLVGQTSSEAKKYAKNQNKKDRQEMRSNNRAERKRTKENRKESRR